MVSNLTWVKHADEPDSGLSFAAVQAADAIARYAGRDGSCYPSISTMAARRRVSRSTIKRGIKELQQHGWLLVAGRVSKAGVKRSNVYQIILPEAVDKPKMSRPKRRGRGQGEPTTVQGGPSTVQGEPTGTVQGDPYNYQVLNSPQEQHAPHNQPDVDNVTPIAPHITSLASKMGMPK